VLQSSGFFKTFLHFSDLEGGAKNLLAQGATIAGYGSDYIYPLLTLLYCIALLYLNL